MITVAATRLAVVTVGFAVAWPFLEGRTEARPSVLAVGAILAGAAGLGSAWSP
jgi:hypothetical protein